MKRIKIIVASALFITTLAMTTGIVKAETPDDSKQILTLNQLINPLKNSQSVVVASKPIEKPLAPKPVPPKTKKYKVVENDNLTKIASKQKTTWKRIWEKNKSIKDPNVIDIGQEIVIPKPDEKLKPRTLPTSSVIPKTQPTSYTVSGNTYDFGYCTYYVKNRRPDLPNNLGNANTWFYMAQNDGLATGTTPKAGAVGTTTAGGLGHVVYIESVNSNGTVNVSEMNYVAFGVISTRVAQASDFLYIY